MDYKIVPLDKSRLTHLPRKGQSFDIIGKLAPTYDGTEWKTEEQLLPTKREKRYPDCAFAPQDYIDNPGQAAYLAMLNGECIGSIRVCRRWNGNGFIDDLEVDRLHRGHGVGTMLMEAAVQWSHAQTLNGLSLETQDNNLLACRFYIKYGFKLGGIDTRVYAGSAYSNEVALYFYLPDALYQPGHTQRGE